MDDYYGIHERGQTNKLDVHTTSCLNFTNTVLGKKKKRNTMTSIGLSFILFKHACQQRRIASIY